MTERAPRDHGFRLEPGRHTRTLSIQVTYRWEPQSQSSTARGVEVELGLYEAYIFDEYITATERYEKLLLRLAADGRLKE